MCILVYNDSSYAAEGGFRRQGYSIDIVQFPETDFATIARGYGDAQQLFGRLPIWSRCGIGSMKARPGVFLIDAKINPDLEADWHAEHFP